MSASAESPIGLLQQANLPTFPAVVFKLQQLVDQGADFTQFADLINTDVSLKTRIIKCANSVYYSTGSESADISTAIRKIGVQRLSDIVYTAKLCEAFPYTHQINMATFWEQSLYTAIVARQLVTELNTRAVAEENPVFALLARLVGRSSALPPSYAYTVGLLSNIGFLVKLLLSPLTTDEVLRYSRQKTKQRYKAQEELGTSPDSEVSSAILLMWGFSEKFYRPIHYQLDPRGAGPHRRMALILNAALSIRDYFVERTMSEEIGAYYFAGLAAKLGITFAECGQLSDSALGEVKALSTFINYRN
ncbi:HDOD domain-containing protein [Exilibacterium tricleocarpae]|uniref:HDOD domain-containing protein n=1 Tax=Exilibacterium tricleocarpae TaxID=2591008 RepID=A0A545T8D4_9GAMM|nr:HDOD domain-containing protein [Exilibacterium tricleocarpae]TQV73467.1 HDOD domain-containing protein [Exilibacterium tricleocarpae]